MGLLKVYNLSDGAKPFGWRDPIHSEEERNQGSDKVIDNAVQKLDPGVYNLLLVWDDNQVRISEVKVVRERVTVERETIRMAAVR